MSIKQTLRKLLLIGSVALGLLAGAPLRPGEVEELLQQVNRPKVVHTLRQEKVDDGD